jgi:outer membrane protein OmpU
MKKSLYMTTALAAASVLALGATDAMAAEKAKKMEVKISGSFTSLVGFTRQNGSFESTASSTARTGYDSFNIVNNSEIHFRGTSKLDNGIAVSVIVQLETDQSEAGGGHTSNAANGSVNNTIDESYVKLTGGFGDVRIGNTKAASFVLKHGAPLGGAIALENPDTNNWIVRPGAVNPSSLSNGTVGTNIGGGDDMKFVYISPKFSGFRLGGSYTPSNSEADTPAAVGGTAGTDTQTYDAMVSYESKLGSVDLKADLGYFEVHGTAATSQKAWRTGISLGFGAITVGGSYQDRDNIDSGQTNLANEAFGVGAQYKTGPFAVGVKYFNVASPQSAAVAGDDEVTKIAVGGSYTMGPGISLVGTIVHVDWDEETTADANNNDGWAAIGGIKVSF